MRRSSFFINGIIILALALILCNCKSKNRTSESEKSCDLTEQSISDFARKIENGILNGHANAINDVLDKDNIKNLVCENSIVYSGFDIEGGKKYFESCLDLGSSLVKSVDNGGDFAFSKYYLEDGVHHIVFHSYDNYVVNFYDFSVDTVKGKLLLKDVFVYSTGCLLSQNIQGGMLYNLLLQTNPDNDVKWLADAEELTKQGKSGKALSVLDEHKESLHKYPIYYQLYIANLYQNDPSHFISKLESFKNELDERHLLLHQLLFHINEGHVTEAEKIINTLIPHTGDDPIFLFLYGYAQLNAHHYDYALDCFKTVEKSMPLIWDLWQCELKCYKKLNDKAGLEKCLQQGKEAYGMSDAEYESYSKQINK